MSKNRYCIVDGRDLQPESITIPRATAIYRVAKNHPFVTDLSCRLTSKGDVLILMTVDCEVPDSPRYPIQEKEPIAIKCYKQDNRIPEVLALRKDFPLGLPHSNAVPYDHPVSLCVSDVLFQDMRTSFSAFNFIESIRRWFAMNSIGQLHENNRPLEVFYNAEEISYFPLKYARNNFYRQVKYRKLSANTSVIEEAKEKDCNYCLLFVPVSANVASYVRRVPNKLGDLRGMCIYNGDPFIDSVINFFWRSPHLRRCEKPLMLALVMPLSREEGKPFEDFNLFALRIDMPVCSILKTYNSMSREHADRFLDDLKVNISFVIPGLTGTQLNDANGKKVVFNEVTLLGAGALGSQILDHFVRGGQSKNIHLIDSDILAPHNVARHTLDITDVMMPKVEALKQKYKDIADLKIYSYPEDFLNCKEQTLERTIKSSDLVIDVSTSVGVERHLAIDFQQYLVKRCTTFLNPKGTDIVLFVEDRMRHHRLDLLEMDYYRNVLINSDLEHHLDTPKKQRTNIFSCRAESVIMDFDNITALGSIVSSQIPKAVTSEQAKLSVWQLDAEKGSIKCLELPISEWKEHRIGNVTIYISQAVLDEMTKQRELKLEGDNPVETGGTFMGTYDRDRNIVYIIYMIPAPDDSVEAGTSYVRGVNGLNEAIEGIKVRTGHQIVYLGEWHSHPHHCSNSPSPKDEQLFETMSDEMTRQDFPFVLGILGDTGLNYKVVM